MVARVKSSQMKQRLFQHLVLQLFETIASNRNLIIPNFNLEHKKKKLVVQIANKKYLINSKKEFYKKLDYYLNSKYVNKKLSYADYKTLKYYIGNYDGMAGKE